MGLSDDDFTNELGLTRLQVGRAVAALTPRLLTVSKRWEAHNLPCRSPVPALVDWLLRRCCCRRRRCCRRRCSAPLSHRQRCLVPKISSSQARKVRTALSALGVAAPAAATPPPAAAAPAPEPAPAPAPVPASAPAVGVPVAAAPPAAPAEPDPRSCFAHEDLQRYRQLDQQMRELRALEVSGRGSLALVLDLDLMLGAS